MQKFLKLFFGGANERILKKYYRITENINALEPSISKLNDEELSLQTQRFKERLEEGETLDQLLPEAFATVREASKRVLGMRPFDVQLIGGITLHNGNIAEMKTGEGKTLMATLPVYLNALTGKGVHLITVNDYLASRDAKNMGKLYNFLGLSVGCIVHGLSDAKRRAAYGADITYGTNHEFGFDYLKDNMKFSKGEMVMRPFNYAIVDEVDSILIDEARTPLIISGPAEDSSELYALINKIIPELEQDTYEKDEKQHSVILTDKGIEFIEGRLKELGLVKGNGLYDVQNIALVHHVHAALKAHKLFARDVDYIVKDGDVLIIDEFTGRMMEGRRYSDGLHQALEAKENVEINTENQTLASITYQNFFRLYPKLSGMAGTAMTEAQEFEEIYRLRVVEIPPNVPVARKDFDDQIYLTPEAKYMAVVKLIKECQEKGQPVLVGTTSIEKSELISRLLHRNGLEHKVLNARHHEQEAFIVAEAGRFGAVTVATNMAGRGTDIQLGGNLEMRLEKELEDIEDEDTRHAVTERIKKEIEEDKARVKEAGGLFIIGTERHESRRVDNQLRGRAGRQGDPGASQFFISIQDDLIRVFGASERMDTMLRRLGTKEDEVLSHKWLNKTIENAQKKVEARNFEVRKHLLRFDDVMSDQRKVIYAQRQEIMDSDNLNSLCKELYTDTVDQFVDKFAPAKGSGDDWAFDEIYHDGKRLFNIEFPIEEWRSRSFITSDDLKKEVYKTVEKSVDQKFETWDSSELLRTQKRMLLQIIDQDWKNHLLTLDHLRQGINLRSYAQGNPLNEYKREAFYLFEVMMNEIKSNFVLSFSHHNPTAYDAHDASDFGASFSIEHMLKKLDIDQQLSSKEDTDWSKTISILDQDINKDEQIDGSSHMEMVPPHSRNSLCPCGSGNRYKFCHGRVFDV